MAEQRLSAGTRELARRVLEGEWGLALADLPLTLDGRADAAAASPAMYEALAVKLIAEQAPVRIDPSQRLAGSATLKAASWHKLPIYRNGETSIWSTSHLTAGFDHALQLGYGGLRRQVNGRIARGSLTGEQLDFLRSMLVCLDAAAIWHRRHMELLDRLIAESDGERRRRYSQMRAALARVPEEPPGDFREAVQALWFLFCFQRLCGNWPGVGRIDQMLGPYLRGDLAAGRITLDEARELIAHFWINGCDWTGAKAWHSGSGDAEYYQNIVISGIDADGNDVTNEVTWLVLDVVEELRIIEYPVAVRISRRTPEKLLRRVAEVQRLGGGTVAVYNEDLVIRALAAFGYAEREARRFANDGCWEVQVPGETAFSYVPIDVLQILQEATGTAGTGPIPEFADFEALYTAFRERLAARIEEFHRLADRHVLGHRGAPLISLLVKDCIEKARGYHDRGARYSVLAPHAGGLPDTGNSLYAFSTLVFEEKRLTWREMAECLRSDWAGREELRRKTLARLVLYGNGNSEADAMVRRVFDDFLELAGRVRERDGVLRPPGVSTFGREIEWRAHRGATPDGHRTGDILATNFSPSPGTDLNGPTAVLRSLGAMGLERLANGCALELKMLPSSLRGEAGLRALVGLLKTFADLGGFFMQVDAVSPEELREAQRHPEKHRHLTVRIAGWSARFVTLSPEWQEMIINRSQQDAAMADDARPEA